MKYLLLSAFLVVLFVPWESPAGCCGGTAAVAAPRAPSFRWVKTPKGQYALYRDNTQVGSYNPAKGHYRRYQYGQFTTVGTSPVKLPAAAKRVVKKERCICPEEGGCDSKCNCHQSSDCDCPSCTCTIQRTYGPINIDGDGTLELTPEGATFTPKGKKAKPTVPADHNFGVDASKIRKGPHYSCRDKASMTKKAATQLVEGIPDDGGKPFLTVIGGTPDQRRKVVEDLVSDPSLAAFKDKLRVQAYAADDWAVTKAGFVTKGNPTIYCQEADGTVMHRQDDYEGGAPALALALNKTSLRKPDPNYPPDKDPDKRKPDPVIPGFPSIPMPVCCLGAIGAIALFFPRKAKS